MTSQHETILKQLGVEGTEEALVLLFEAVGSLVLCVHWLRGTFNWMMHTGAVQWPSEEGKANYERLFETIKLYEQIVWEVAPSRAAVVGLRDMRSGGDVTLDELLTLLTQDAQGRIPFDVDEQELEDINDILRRLGQARLARMNGATHDLATKRAHKTTLQQGMTDEEQNQ